SDEITACHHLLHLRDASNVDYILSVPVQGHVEGAIASEIIHRHDVGEAVLVDGGKGSLLALPEERGLLVGTQLDLLASSARHSCTSPLGRLDPTTSCACLAVVPTGQCAENDHAAHQRSPGDRAGIR